MDIYNKSETIELVADYGDYLDIDKKTEKKII